MSRVGTAGTDWRDTLSVATDLAIVGIVVTVAAVPVLTAGAAVRTGSVAAHALVTAGRLPSSGDLWRVFRRALVPGAAASAVVLAVAALLAVDLTVVSSGRAPGGPAVLVVTGGVAAVLAAVAALTVVRLGTAPTAPWRAAAGWAVGAARRAPGTAAAVAGVLVLAVVLAVLVPATAPLLAGYVLFALHVLAVRLR